MVTGVKSGYEKVFNRAEHPLSRHTHLGARRPTAKAALIIPEPTTATTQTGIRYPTMPSRKL